MRSFFKILIVLTLFLMSNWAYAGVRFITDVPTNSFTGKASSNSASSLQNRCASIGYTRTADSCGKGKIATTPCPYGGGYYKSCCDEEYRYTREYCIRRGLKPSSSSCEGKYSCH